MDGRGGSERGEGAVEGQQCSVEDGGRERKHGIMPQLAHRLFSASPTSLLHVYSPRVTGPGCDALAPCGIGPWWDSVNNAPYISAICYEAVFPSTDPAVVALCDSPGGDPMPATQAAVALCQDAVENSMCPGGRDLRCDAMAPCATGLWWDFVNNAPYISAICYEAVFPSTDPAVVALCDSPGGDPMPATQAAVALCQDAVENSMCPGGEGGRKGMGGMDFGKKGGMGGKGGSKGSGRKGGLTAAASDSGTHRIPLPVHVLRPEPPWSVTSH